MKSIPAPLKNIFDPRDYPFAVGCVRDGELTHTVEYASSLEECYFMTQGWRASAYRSWSADYIMVENRQIGEETATSVNTYWVPV